VVVLEILVPDAAFRVVAVLLVQRRSEAWIVPPMIWPLSVFGLTTVPASWTAA
jgi:hypothetical protein